MVTPRWTTPTLVMRMTMLEVFDSIRTITMDHQVDKVVDGVDFEKTQRQLLKNIQMYVDLVDNGSHRMVVKRMDIETRTRSDRDRNEVRTFEELSNFVNSSFLRKTYEELENKKTKLRNI